MCQLPSPATAELGPALVRPSFSNCLFLLRSGCQRCAWGFCRVESILREGQNGAQRRERTRELRLGAAPLCSAWGSGNRVNSQQTGCLPWRMLGGVGWAPQIKGSKEFKTKHQLPLAANVPLSSPWERSPRQKQKIKGVEGSKDSHSLNQQKSLVKSKAQHTCGIFPQSSRLLNEPVVSRGYVKTCACQKPSSGT